MCSTIDAVYSRQIQMGATQTNAIHVIRRMLDESQLEILNNVYWLGSWSKTMCIIEMKGDAMKQGRNWPKFRMQSGWPNLHEFETCKLFNYTVQKRSCLTSSSNTLYSHSLLGAFYGACTTSFRTKTRVFSLKKLPC